MEGDFTRNSDDPEAGYSGVLMQQGRVQLDADWNEQWVIQTRALRSALRDLIGRHGGPANGLGFQIGKKAGNDQTLTVGRGVYYVDGIRVSQRDADLALSMNKRKKGPYLAFLDVWERHVNAIEDPRIREVALLGPDTATRAEVLWRVRLLEVVNIHPTMENVADLADKVIAETLRRRVPRRLSARASTVNAAADPCKLSPLAQYRGRENQLYRVEIHEPIVDDRVDAAKDPVLFTFKWSRDNGSVVLPIVQVVAPEGGGTAGDREIVVTVQLGHLGRDDRFGLQPGNIVEFVHDALTRQTLDDRAVPVAGDDPGRSGLLGRVLAPIDRDALTVRIAVFADDVDEIAEGTLHPYLRRWDQQESRQQRLRAGAVPVRGSELGKWLPLEAGVEIRFEPPQNKEQIEQRAGDYWQIPARTATGDVLWPTVETGSPPVKTPQPRMPMGTYHHYAPLAVLEWSGNAIGQVTGVRRAFEPLAIPEPTT